MATTTFDNLITFSRGSNATVTGPNGLIQWAPNNLVRNSESFEEVTWAKNNVTLAINSAVAPDSTSTADLMISIASTAITGPNYASGGTFTATPHTQSVYVKAATNIRYIQLLWTSGAVSTDYANFDLQTGAVTAGTYTSAAMTSVGNGWYRISMTSIPGAGSAGGMWPIAVPAATSTRATAYPGNGTDSFLLWGAQLELGSTATTYNNTSVRNLLGFSEAFDNAAWTKSAASIVTGAQANPVNGLFNAQKLMENTAAATQHYTRQLLTPVVSGPIATLSIYAKAGERRYIGLLEGFSNKGQYFDLQTGTVGGILVGAPSSASITAVGNGWYRCSITTPVTSTTISQELYLSATGTSISYTGDGNSGVYIYGAMLSNSASLDPYVPTPGAAPSSTAYYGPRFDYDPVTLLPRGFLVEEARTNLLLRSEEFDNAAWAKTNATVTANATNAPDGTTTADRVTITGNSIGVRQTSSATASTQVRSFYVKIDSGVRFFQILTDGSVNAFANFDLLLGVIGTKGSSVSDHTITAVGNDWYRIAMVSTDAIANSTYCSPVTSASAGWSTGASSGSFFIWGAQLETGAFATSYIPTIASTVTRSADVATITGSLFSQWWNAAQGGFIVEATTSSRIGTNPTQEALINLTSSLRLTRGAGSASIGWFLGSTTFMSSGVTTPLALVKSAGAYSAGNNAASTNGAAVTTDAGSTYGSPTQFDVGNIAGGSFFNGWLRSIRYVPVRAADFQLQALTELPLVPTLDLDFLNSLYEA
jgi:hypothetical protein